MEQLLMLGRVRRAGRGRPRVRPNRLVGDNGDSYPTIRRLLARRGIVAVIPRRRDQPAPTLRGVRMRRREALVYPKKNDRSKARGARRWLIKAHAWEG